MTALAVMPEATMTVDEAVEAVWSAVLSGSFVDPAEAVRAMWHSFRFSEDERNFLAVNGLIERSKHAQRLQRNERRPVIAVGAPHGKKWERYIALTWPYEAADGTQRTLLNFDTDDLAAFALYAGKIASAYARRKEWAQQTLDLLTEHGVARVRELPAGVLAEVDAAARQAMGRQQ